MLFIQVLHALRGELFFKFKSTTNIKKQEVDINIKIDLANLTARVNKRCNDASGKVKTCLTVSQIAYLARLLLDSGILSSDRITDVMSRITNCMVTKNATQISIKSLKAKFYSQNPGTKLSVKKLLQTLAESIHVYE